MAQYINQPNIWARIGTGLGQGLADQLPKEIERGRMAQGLQDLGQKQGLSPFESFSQLVAIPGVAERPQLMQSFSDLLRQKSIIDSIQQSQKDQQPKNVPMDLAYLRSQKRMPKSDRQDIPPSPTTTQGVQNTLNPYIPLSGEEITAKARQRYVSEPMLHPTLESARNSVMQEEDANIARSNALIQARSLERDVKNTAENELLKEIQRLGVKIPGNALSKLETKALDAVRSGHMTEDQAGKVFGKEADEMSKNFENVNSWGSLSLITRNPKDLLLSIKAMSKYFNDLNYKREFADSMIADNGFSPELSYYLANYTSNNPGLAQAKKLSSLKSPLKSYVASLGLAGALYPLMSTNSKEQTLKIAPSLAKSMGKEGSPMAIAYELDRKGYDAQAWKDYLIDHQNDLDLTSGQINELGKTPPSFMGILNDLWFKSFSGMK